MAREDDLMDLPESEWWPHDDDFELWPEWRAARSNHTLQVGRTTNQAALLWLRQRLSASGDDPSPQSRPPDAHPSQEIFTDDLSEESALIQGAASLLQVRPALHSQRAPERLQQRLTPAEAVEPEAVEFCNPASGELQQQQHRSEFVLFEAMEHAIPASRLAARLVYTTSAADGWHMPRAFSHGPSADDMDTTALRGRLAARAVAHPLPVLPRAEHDSGASLEQLRLAHSRLGDALAEVETAAASVHAAVEKASHAANKVAIAAQGVREAIADAAAADLATQAPGIVLPGVTNLLSSAAVLSPAVDDSRQAGVMNLCTPVVDENRRAGISIPDVIGVFAFDGEQFVMSL